MRRNGKDKKIFYPKQTLLKNSLRCLLMLVIIYLFQFIFLFFFQNQQSLNVNQYTQISDSNFNIPRERHETSDRSKRLRKNDHINSDKSLINQISLVDGYDEAIKFLNNYDTSNGQLYILFMSSMGDDGDYWCQDCRQAKSNIHNAFQKASSSIHMLEVRVGNRKEWKDEDNLFRTSEIFYIDYIPSILQWNGNGKSSNLLVQNYCTNSKLVEYVFKVPDIVHYVETRIKSNNITIYSSSEWKELQWVLQDVQNIPLFVFFISDIIPFTGRLWCPYCDQSEVAVDFFFKMYSLKNSRLHKAIVAKDSSQWSEESSNPFRDDSFFQVESIPSLFKIGYKNDGTRIKQEYNAEFHDFISLKSFFESNLSMD